MNLLFKVIEDEYRNKFSMGETVRTKWQFLFYWFVAKQQKT